MVAKDKEDNNVTIPRRTLNTEESIRRFVRSIHRQAQSKERNLSFPNENFVVKNYLGELYHHNVQLALYT